MAAKNAKYKPEWQERDLIRHHKKRTSTDKGCFESLLGIKGRPMYEQEYEHRSKQAVEKSWAEYECQARWNGTLDFHERSAYFVDCQLVVSITNLDRTVFSTCYHEHFNRKHDAAYSPSESEGEKRLRYKKMLENEERGKLICNLKRIRGV